MAQIRWDDPDLSLRDLMGKWPQTIPVFIRHKMFCVGCLVNPFHTVKDACAVYSLNIDAFYDELAAALKHERPIAARVGAVHKQ